jgi:hypothetical protein
MTPQVWCEQDGHAVLLHPYERLAFFAWRVKDGAPRQAGARHGRATHLVLLTDDDREVEVPIDRLQRLELSVRQKLRVRDDEVFREPKSRMPKTEDDARLGARLPS